MNNVGNNLLLHSSCFMLDSPMRYVMITTLMAMVYTAMAKEPDLTLECQKHGDQQVFT